MTWDRYSTKTATSDTQPSWGRNPCPAADLAHGTDCWDALPWSFTWWWYHPGNILLLSVRLTADPLSSGRWQGQRQTQTINGCSGTTQYACSSWLTLTTINLTKVVGMLGTNQAWWTIHPRLGSQKCPPAWEWDAGQSLVQDSGWLWDPNKSWRNHLSSAPALLERPND